MTSACARSLGRLVQDIESGVPMESIASSLAAAARRSRPRSVELVVTDGVLHVDGTAVDAAEAPEVQSLLAVFVRHRLTGLSIHVGITPRELLQLAALLAVKDTDPSLPTIFEAARRLGFWNIELAGEPANVNTPTFPLPTAFPLGTVTEADTQIAALTTELNTAVEHEDAVAVATALTRALLTAVAAKAAPVDPDCEPPCMAERWQQCFANMATAPALRLLTGLLVTDEFPHEHVVAILRHADNAGTAALMEQLTAAGTVFHRRVFFDTIVEIGAGTSVLVAHLAHPQWYVVRNAACLLGAMKALDAENALVKDLSHADERVRLSVATALIQLGTSSGRRALESAINDTSSQVRRRILQALLRDDGVAMSAAVISEALDLERDPEVQMEIVASLRKMGTPHAVQQLVRLCSPYGSSNKSAEFQRASIEALAALRPTAAAPFLRIRTHDRDPAVRQHAKTLLDRTKKVA